MNSKEEIAEYKVNLTIEKMHSEDLKHQEFECLFYKSM